MSESAVSKLMNYYYLSTDHMSKFNEILATFTDLCPKEVLVMWDLHDMIITPVGQNTVQYTDSTVIL